MNKTMKWFITAIAAMGVVRFILNMNGVPNDIVKYFSMTGIILIGLVYFGIAAATHKERLKAAYLLIMPYMTIEVLALGYTWATGRQTIFHTAEYSWGMNISTHFLGHLIGGVTWEPLFAFLVMEVVWGIYAGGRSVLKSKAT